MSIKNGYTDLNIFFIMSGMDFRGKEKFEKLLEILDDSEKLKGFFLQNCSV